MPDLPPYPTRHLILVSALRKICGALIGSAIIGLVQIAGLPVLNIRLKLSALFFALSLPLLAFFFLHDGLQLRDGALASSIIMLTGIATGLTGLAMFIFHVYIPAGIVFVVVLAAAYSYLFLCVSADEKRHWEALEDSDT